MINLLHLKWSACATKISHSSTWSTIIRAWPSHVRTNDDQRALHSIRESVVASNRTVGGFYKYTWRMLSHELSGTLRFAKSSRRNLLHTSHTPVEGTYVPTYFQKTWDKLSRMQQSYMTRFPQKISYIGYLLNTENLIFMLVRMQLFN